MSGDIYRTQVSRDNGATWEPAVEPPRCPNEGQACNCTGACQRQPIPGIDFGSFLRAHEWPTRQTSGPTIDEGRDLA